MDFLEAKNVKHRFDRRDEEGKVIGEVEALDGVDLEVKAGQFIAILGQNGSGKSTFARHVNALLTPTEGTLLVDGKDTKDSDVMWEIRRAAGMIFQNPDNQIVAGLVEEDVAFGPENLGVPTEEIEERVADSLHAVDMEEYRHHSPERLSGGQKQRVAVAGVLAMQPECILMDEPTAMLDPAGRREVIETAHRLCREGGVTIILITHFMEEAAGADRIFVLDRGRVVMSGSPREIFSEPDQLKKYGLDLPQIPRLACELKRDGWPIPEGVLTREELVDELRAGSGREAGSVQDSALSAGAGENAAGADDKESKNAAYEKTEKLRMEGVSYSYSPGTVYETRALRDIDLAIREGEMVGLIGQTGSGKSTLIQMFNGLLQPDQGTVFFEGQDIGKAGFDRGRLRGDVGLVFQFPEQQLFESTVLKDVAYGPKNLGLDEDAARDRAENALRQVELDEENWELSPFELSGGQKRRAAIAGVLAMEPSVLILDEPTAGLDPHGKEELFDLIRGLHERLGITVLIVSHNMEDMADLADRIVVLRDGQIMLDGAPKEVFSHIRELEEVSLSVPEVTYLMEDLKALGYPIETVATTLNEAKREIERVC
ncbi:MAG: energy-coupling factor transporter ATPase [Lachnospiraceae bacterium]|nr:energy-coupling factor transporter ATPase [Lachnospiraceae bacterium]